MAEPENHEKPAEEASDDTQLIEELLFKQDLNETHLLIDFVSGRADRSLSTLSMADPENPTKILTSGEVMKAIAEMRYPPNGTKAVNARNAAILLVAKDRLSGLAAPANGLTIAYTRMFIDTEAGGSSGPDNYLQRLRGRHRSPHRDIRIDLAQRSFPGLQAHAQKFRVWRDRLAWLSLLWLFLTGVAYWDAGLGRAALERLDQDWKGFVADLRDDPSLARCGEDVDTAQTQAKNDADRKLVACRRHEYQRLMGVAAVADVQRAFGCDGIRYSAPIHVWCWNWLISGSRMPGEADVKELLSAIHPNAARILQDPEQAAHNTIFWQTATSVLSVFTSYVLPMMFGLLGTLIGAFRAILNRIGVSELAPRDLVRMKIGVPTGLVAGIAVGLFFSPSSVPAQGAGGVAGQFTLTACGLGFLAGYASQSFFNYLDNLLGTVFPTSAPTTAGVSHSTVTISATSGSAAAPTLSPPAAPPSPPTQPSSLAQTTAPARS